MVLISPRLQVRRRPLRLTLHYFTAVVQQPLSTFKRQSVRFKSWVWLGKKNVVFSTFLSCRISPLEIRILICAGIYAFSCRVYTYSAAEPFLCAKTFPLCTRRLCLQPLCEWLDSPHSECASRVICETKATADRSGARSLEMAGCHHERHTIPQLEDPGLSLCVGKHSPCLSILEQDTDPWQLWGGCSAADLLKESGKRQGSWTFVVIII